MVAAGLRAFVASFGGQNTAWSLLLVWRSSRGLVGALALVALFRSTFQFHRLGDLSLHLKIGLNEKILTRDGPVPKFTEFFLVSRAGKNLFQTVKYFDYLSGAIVLHPAVMAVDFWLQYA